MRDDSARLTLRLETLEQIHGDVCEQTEKIIPQFPLMSRGPRVVFCCVIPDICLALFPHCSSALQRGRFSVAERRNFLEWGWDREVLEALHIPLRFSSKSVERGASCDPHTSRNRSEPHVGREVCFCNGQRARLWIHPKILASGLCWLCLCAVVAPVIWTSSQEQHEA